jgi:NAD(P)-dependent dehydrogenase (short-subunit alcohol dehydrogenase family)
MADKYRSDRSWPSETSVRYAEFQRRTAVVTGAASGIGAAVAEEFSGEGATVVLIDIDQPALAARVDQLRRNDRGAVRAIALDVTDDARIGPALDQVIAETGDISFLVNCAATFTAAGIAATRSQWDRALSVNVAGAARMVAEAAQRMSHGGAIVNTASVSAHVAQPDRWTYNATKGAIVSMTRCQALDLAARHIRVNCLSPGWIWTPEVFRAAGGDRARYEPVWGDFHILRRLGEPREVARVALFLCSDEASFITGTELMVDGGYHALSAEGLGQASHFAASE